MKICIVSMTNMFLCPYIGKYLDALPKDMEIHLLYWDRHGIEENVHRVDKTYKYENNMNERVNKFNKLTLFLKFNSFCESIIKKNNYDRIIFLHNYMAILMLPFLLRLYRHRYLIDIRDYSFEHNKVFYNLEKAAIKNAGMAVISSEGYKNFLPSADYVLCHNDPVISDEEIEKITTYKKDECKPIQISFIGLVRFYEQNKKLLDLLANDNRFIVAFYGQNSEPLRDYAEKNGIRNTIFKGRFDPSETTGFYEETDIINNYYGNHTPVLDYALSNKLYYAASFRKPILVCPDTFMNDISSKHSFGIVLDDSISSADQLFDRYSNIDKDTLEKGCRAFLEEVEAANTIFKTRINDFVGR